MEEQFDPYHLWLGIPRSEQPPNLYCLLGLNAFENDPAIITASADHRIAHLSEVQRAQVQEGHYAQVAEQLLNELSRAKQCLLNSDDKRVYDSQLEAMLRHSQTAVVPPPLPQEISTLTVDDPLSKYRKKNRPWIAITLITLLILGGGGGILAYLKYFSDTPVETAQGESGNESESGNPENSSAPADNDPTDPAKKKSADEIDDEKKKRDADSSTAKNDGDSRKSGEKDPSDSSGANSKDADPKSPGVDSQSKSKVDDETEPAIIIGRTNKKSREKGPVQRVPLPQLDQWKPFLRVLTREYDIKEDLPRQSRYVLVDELLQYAVDERNPDRAFAIFNMVLDQFKALQHSHSAGIFAEALSKRFQVDENTANVMYLKSIGESLESKPAVAAFLNQLDRLVDELDSKKEFSLVHDLLSAVINIADKPIGRDVDRSHFEMQVKASGLKLKIMRQLSRLQDRQSKGTLTADDHRLLGTYQCFINQDWSAGLKHYSKCGVKPIVEVARQESDLNLTDRSAMEELGEFWLSASERVEDESFLFRRRAKHWFAKVEKSAPPGQVSKKTRKRLEELNQGIGLKRQPSGRSADTVLLLEQKERFNLQSNSESKSLRYLDANSLGVLHKDEFRIFDVQKNLVVFGDESYQHFNHPLICFGNGRFALLTPRSGLRASVLSDLESTGGISKSSRSFRVKHPIRAADISADGTVYALSDKFVYRWTNEQAWGDQQIQNPNSIESPNLFIPQRIHAIPNSSAFVLWDHRNLVRVSKSNTVSQLFSGDHLVDVDFAANGAGLVMATKKELRYKAFRGTRKVTIPVASELITVRFLGNPRFLLTVHKDNTICAWDLSGKNGDFLVDRIRFLDFAPVDLALSPSGDTVAVLDKKSSIRRFRVHRE